MNTDVELLVPVPVTGTSRVDGDTTADVDFNRRWALWLKRGRAHDRRVRCLRRGRAAVVVGGLRPAVDRVGPAPGPIAVGDFPVARELAAFGFRWFSPADPGPLQVWLADPDPALLDGNEEVARRHFGLDALVRRLDLLLSGAPMCHHSGASTEGNTTACDCLTA